MRYRWGWIVWAALAASLAGITALGQADLDQFPAGATTMTYRIESEETSEPQTLELVVIVRADGRFTVRMTTEATGTGDELSGFGFLFGATSVAYGAGRGVSYSALQALIDQRSRLQEGQDYLLPGGAEFSEIIGVDIAGVGCLQGTFIDPKQPNTQMTVAFGLTHPVFISPRIVAREMRNGEWTETFRMELTEYVHAESEE